MEILLIVLRQVSVAASVALALHSTCKEMNSYQNFCLHFGKAEILAGGSLPWPVLRRCLRYIATVQPDIIDNISLHDVANLLITFNYQDEAYRLYSSQSDDCFFNGFMSNGSVDLLNSVPEHYMHLEVYKTRFLMKMRIPMQSAGQLDYFDMWGCWLYHKPIGHIYKFLAKTMRARSVVALDWCLGKLAQKISPVKFGCVRRHYTWLEYILKRQEQWPKRIYTIKIFANAWDHPRAVEFAKRFK